MEDKNKKLISPEEASRVMMSKVSSTPFFNKKDKSGLSRKVVNKGIFKRSVK